MPTNRKRLAQEKIDRAVAAAVREATAEANYRINAAANAAFASTRAEITAATKRVQESTEQITAVKAEAANREAYVGRLQATIVRLEGEAREHIALRAQLREANENIRALVKAIHVLRPG